MSSADTVYAALPAKGSGEWAHPKTVAETTGMGYSTATRWLRQLVTDGLAETIKHDKANVYRRTGRAAVSVDAPDRAETFTVDPVPAELAPCGCPVQLIDDDGHQEGCEAAVMVWVAARRKGLNYHQPLNNGHTACGRPTHTYGHFRPLHEVEADSKLCPQCEAAIAAQVAAAEAEAAESPAERAKSVTQTDTRTEPGTPTGGSVAAVLGYMEAARPISAPPAPEAKPKREPKPRAKREPRESGPKAKPAVTYQRGQLRDLVLGYLRGMEEGTDATAGEIGKALGAPYVGPISSNLDRMVKAGTALKTSESPARFRAA